MLAILEFVALAAIWGASYLAMQLSVPAFGVFAMGFVRAFAAAAVLVPILLTFGRVRIGRRQIVPTLVLGLMNTAVPVSLNSWSLSHITTGLSSIINATMPLFGSVVAWLWLDEKLTRLQALGLAIGFGGVGWLSWDGIRGVNDGYGGLAILAGMGAALVYGASSSFSRRYLPAAPPLAIATGSQVGGMFGLCLPALMTMPGSWPGGSAWLAVLSGGIVCSAIGYLMFFRMVARSGPSLPLTVTFLVPVFALFYGAVIAGEPFTLRMAAGGAVVLVGVAMATDVLSALRRSMSERMARVPE